MIGISACLTGIACRYDGRSNLVRPLDQLIQQGKAVAFCPEVLGGLTTPREPAEIVGGTAEDVWLGNAKVITISGEDVTQSFQAGAKRALEQAQQAQITVAVLKANSPSCGSQMVYDGTFSGNKIIGSGLTAALFRQNNIQVVDEHTCDFLFEEYKLL
ncbi:DUF523 domain-containing protein [Paenibacillus sp. KACC 21273]|uniref:DUF523 domain-containing protein n=1 Tax=Paenibacillus sp. KACC 21273 TaxID=3025665 RepID=UPI0023662C4F|nr:DUF523 domain-containing protein [Paenibacillus sp. KACC 21273]WDF50160.1 DUF523 domain-containing protein [Paenibacillus sp. KACC 21273]